MDSAPRSKTGDISEPHHAHVRLDVVRGIAALLVFAVHITQIFFWRMWGDHSQQAIASGVVARHAVLVFFLLSGHLITKSIISNVRRHGGFNIADYAASRIARIYPPLFGSMAICVLAFFVMKAFDLPGAHAYGLPGDIYRVRTDFGFSAREIIYALLMRGGMTNPNGALWSLFIEFQIYVVAMAAAAWWQRDWLGRAWTAVLGIAAAYLLRDSFFYVLVWMLGAATAFMPSFRRFSWIALAASVLAILGIALWQPSLIGPNMDTTPGQITQLAFCVGYAAFLFYLYPQLRYPRALIATGNFSYSLYIIHFPILLLLLSFTQDWIGHSQARTMVATLTVATAIIAFVIPFALLLEQPAFFKAMIFRVVSLLPAKLRRRNIVLPIVGLLIAIGSAVQVYRHIQ